MDVPCSDELEQVTLGSLLIDGTLHESENAREIMAILSPDDFFYYKNRLIYQGICTLWKQGYPVDQVTVTDQLIQSTHLDQVGAHYLSHIISLIPTSIHAIYYAKRVRELSLSRKRLSTIAQSAQDAWNGKQIVKGVEL